MTPGVEVAPDRSELTSVHLSSTFRGERGWSKLLHPPVESAHRKLSFPRWMANGRSGFGRPHRAVGQQLAFAKDI